MTQRAYREGERVAGRFLVRTWDGAGPLGERYLAFDEAVGLEVELRVVHAALLPDVEARQTFRERMQRTLAFDHPYLLRLHAVLGERGREVLVVQRAAGPTLRDRVASAVPMPWEEARPLLGQVAAATAHAHELGVVLGDLRPSTVLTLAGGVKVTSMGVALALPRDPYLAAIGSHREARHLAPELRHGSACDVRGDVYSFAALALTVLTGAELEAAGDGAARAPAPAPVLAALERNLVADPHGRVPTVEALLSALDRGAASTRRRTGPVTLPANVTSAAGPAVPWRSPNSERVAADDAARQAVTRRVDEERLRRLAGEVSDLLETTRQAAVDEIGLLRQRSAAPDPGGPELGDGQASTTTRREAFPRTGSGMWSRPAVPTVIEEDDDLEFDLGTLRRPRPDQREESVAEDTRVERRETPASGEPPIAAPPDGASPVRATPVGATPVGATPVGATPVGATINRADELTGDRVDERADHRAGNVGGDGAAGAEAVPVRADAAGDLTDEVQDRLSGPPAQLEFRAPPDPFALALAAAHGEPSDPAASVAAAGGSPIVSPGPQPDGVSAPVQPGAEAGTELLDSDLLVEEGTPTHQTLAFPDARQEIADGWRALADSDPLPDTPADEAVAPVPPRQDVPDGAALAEERAARQRATRAARARERLILLAGGVCLFLGVLALVFVLTRPPIEPEPLGTEAAPPPTAGRGREPVEAAPAAPAPAPRLLPVPPSDTSLTPGEGRPPHAPAPATPARLPATPLPPPVPVAADTPAKRTAGAAAAVAGANGCPRDMVRVGAGSDVCIDAFEFPGGGALPRIGVSRDEAAQLCGARGARLCAAREWEQACRGPSGASYPYGASYRPRICNTGPGLLKPAGSMPDCRSEAGAFDMSGNAAEWTAAGGIRGGATGDLLDSAGRCSREVRSNGEARPNVGFRCCTDAK